MAEESVQRRLAAILAADVVGYSRLMGEDEEGTLATLKACREVIDGLIAEHGGRIFGSAGDSVIAEFASPVNAVRCTRVIQTELEKRNEEVPETRRMWLRIGLHLGDVMVEEGNLLGNGVNVAARLETVAEPGGICMSRSVLDQAQHLGLGYEDLGELRLKNIAEPVRAYRVLKEPQTVSGATSPRRRSGLWKAAAASIVFALLVAAAAFSSLRLGAPDIDGNSPPGPSQPSIAVLPFVNMSGNKEQEYFSDGITEDIATDLSKVPGLLVIARSSTNRYKGTTLNAGQISRELGVRYLVEGSVRKAADTVRISAQLVDATTGKHVWAERYDRDLKDVFAIQDDVTGNIVASLAVTLTTDDRQRMTRRHVPNSQAHDYVLRGFSTFVPPTKENLTAARPMFEKAIALDPDYNMGYAGLATIHALLVFTNRSESPERDTEIATRMARKAISLEDTSARPHLDLARLHLLRGQFDEAVDELEEAVRIEPGHAIAQALYGQFLARVGRVDDSIGHTELALRLTSQDYGVMSHAGITYFLLEDYARSLQYLERTEEISGGMPPPRRAVLAAAYVLSGNKQAAEDVVKRILEEAPRFTVGAALPANASQSEAANERLAQALREAGLPDR